MNKRIYVYLGLILVVLIVILQNVQPVLFRLFFWKLHVSLVILLIIMLLFGMGLGMLASRYVKAKERNKSIQ